MIKSFGNRETEALYRGECPAAFRAFRKVAERKLQMLEAAAALQDLRSPPGNRLEKLSADRAGQYSIRINDQWVSGASRERPRRESAGRPAYGAGMRSREGGVSHPESWFLTVCFRWQDGACDVEIVDYH